jgi:uncharacterized protein YdhG (YjbR/CyaY superfamily)
MVKRRPTTIPEYIEAAPSAGQPYLTRVYELLKSVAPEADEAIKWGTPFFVQPKFLFAFSAHKAHLNFTPGPEGLEPFAEELKGKDLTKGSLQIHYDQPFPEELVRKIAEDRVQVVSQKEGDSFW